MLKRVVQPMGDRLDHLNHFSKLHCDALCGGGRVIQFMCKAGRPGSARNSRRGHAAGKGQCFTLMLDLSRDWAPGLSGAAVIDECGIAIGLVSRIPALQDDEEGAALDEGTFGRDMDGRS
jgi:hypothetical protein